MCKIVHYILAQFFNITKYIRMVLGYTILKIFEYYQLMKNPIYIQYMQKIQFILIPYPHSVRHKSLPG